MRLDNPASGHAHRITSGGANHRAVISSGSTGSPDDDPAVGGFLSLLASLESASGSSDIATLSDVAMASTGGVMPPGGAMSPELNTASELVGDAGGMTESLLLQAGGQTLLFADTQAIAQYPQNVVLDVASQLMAQSLAEIRDATNGIRAGGLARSGVKAQEDLAADAPGLSSAMDSLLAQRSSQLPSGKQDAVDAVSDAMKVLADDLARSRVDDAHRPGGHILLDSRAVKSSLVAEGAVKTLTLTEVALANGMGDATLKQAERSLAKSTVMRVDTASDGGFGLYPTPFSGGRVDGSVATSAPALLPPEVLVAEQVNYWISRDVQNAELKLNGFDGLPVEVSISMHGNEAQVDFRTDQAEIREILQEAEPHLKHMLAKEGLVLSGVSVGTSAQNPHDAPDQQTRKSLRPERSDTDAVQAALPTATAPRASDASGRALDIFV
jgi:hypothetical protein